MARERRGVMGRASGAARVAPRTARVAAGLAAVAAVLGPASVLALGPAGCGEPPAAPTADGRERVAITLGGERFLLELAADEATRTKGLGGRASIDPDGGMLFVFKDSAVRAFIMRDCLTPIDIVFVDASGRVTATHHMPIEPPRGEGEGVAGDLDPRKPENLRYELRLKRYASRFAAAFVIELAGGTLERIKVREGDKVGMDVQALRARAE